MNPGRQNSFEIVFQKAMALVFPAMGHCKGFESIICVFVQNLLVDLLHLFHVSSANRV